MSDFPIVKVKHFLLVFIMAIIPNMLSSVILLTLLNCSPILSRPKGLSYKDSKEIITNFSETDKFQVEHNNSAELNPFHNSVYISNSTDESGSQIILKNKHKNFTLLLLFVFIALFIIIINVRVFCLVTSRKQQKSRTVNIFLAHLSALAIGFTFVSFLHVLEMSNIFSITAPGLCELFSFLRIGLLCVFPLNAVAIIYVRVTSPSNTTGNNILPYRVVCLIWLISMVGNFPSVFMVEYTKDLKTQQEICKQISLFGRYELTILYEVFRFFIFHFLECSYMAFVMFQIRAKIKYLYILKPIPNPRMKRKVQRIRYLYVHSFVFISIWFPTGVVIGIYKVICRKDPVLEYSRSYFTPLVILCTSLFILSPLIYLLLHEDVSTKSFCGLSFWPQARSIDENRTQEEYDIEAHQQGRINISRQHRKLNKRKEKKLRKKLYETTDLSRISTLGEGSNIANQQNNPTGANILPVQRTCELDARHPAADIEDPGCSAKSVVRSFRKETSV